MNPHIKVCRTIPPTRTFALALASALALAASAFAQDFTLDWWTPDSGGTSSGGVHAVSLTLGQPDAGQMNCGRYGLASGFWGAWFVPRPPLAIRPGAARTFILAWPAGCEGFALETCANLVVGTWSRVGTTPQVVGNEKRVIVPLPQPGSACFYRLRQP